jgi:two-component system, OmpR family, sensor histidine kinase VicK
MEVAELRHLDGVKGNFGVSDGIQYWAYAYPTPRTKVLEQMVFSSVKALVEQQQYFFDTLWNKAIRAEQKIRQIEEGVDPDIIKIIQDPDKIQKLGFELLKSATNEILIIFSTANAFHRQMYHAKVMKVLLKMVALSKRKLNVRILTPIDERIKETISKLKEEQQGKEEARQIEIQPASETRVTILVVDRKFSLGIELKEDRKKTSTQAIGLASYSNSKSTVLSYASIFESLWNQIKLYEDLAAANERLKLHEMMQKEFITIAAHELRTPLQPIISYNDLALKNKIDKNRAMRVIDKQARRLQKLANDLLAVSKIETGSLSYNMKQIRIADLILDVVKYYNTASITNPNLSKEVSIMTNLDADIKNVKIYADRGRITQVLSNIIDNAMKFTKKGVIKVECHRVLSYDNHKIKNKKSKKIEIRITDTGTGIPKDIIPKIFEKFVTTSAGYEKNHHGIGLGLFISKAIVRAHNGDIIAFNNSKRGNDGGATFSIVLPIKSTLQ